MLNYIKTVAITLTYLLVFWFSAALVGGIVVEAFKALR